MSDKWDSHNNCWTCRHDKNSHSDVVGCIKCACKVLGGEA